MQVRSLRTAAMALLISAAFVAVMLGCAPTRTQVAGVPDNLDFNWHVRPILSDNCFRCHGPDAKTREAGLRLDIPEAAFAELAETPGKHAIVPGDPDESEVMRRITASDPEERMPPLQTHKVLTDAQVAIIRRWIDDGAEYKPHWAFISPEKPKVPRADFDDRAVNEVDRFVFARLEQEGWQPAAEADKETLVNRVTLTLTGLPPSMEEVDAFVADESADAYEKLVDRLLASTEYAEHIASYWMDLGRWAESDGFLDDFHDRFLWPWRDWLIQALHKNMPYDEFGTWQLAGDLLPNATRDQMLATAFLRLGRRSTEAGAIDEEYRVEYAVDRANTVGTAFMGLTTGCARCHDHKYDPISQKDFYSLTGFFNSVDEPGYYPSGQEGVQAGPTLAWPTAEQQAKIEQAAEQARASEANFSKVRQAAVDALSKQPVNAGALAQEVQSSLDKALVAHYPLETTAPIPDRDLPSLIVPRRPTPPELVVYPSTTFSPFGPRPPNQGQVLTQGQGQGAGARPANPRPNNNPFAGPIVPPAYIRELMVYSPSGIKDALPAVLQSPILKPGIKGNALYFDEENKGFLGKGVGFYDRTHAFSMDLWFYPAEKYPHMVPVINNRDDDYSGGVGYRLEIEDGRLHFYMAHSRPYNMIAVVAKNELPLKKWSHISMTYDGSSKAAGLKLYVDGHEAEVEAIRDNLTLATLPNGFFPAFDSFVGMTFGSRFREKSPVGSGMDEIRVFDRALTPLEVHYLHDAKSALQRESLAAELADVRVENEPAVVETRKALTEARQVHNELVTRTPQVLVMADAPVKRPTYLLERGVYSAKADEVPVQALPQIFPWDASLPANRLGLAKWLFDPKNPLTSRVFVNRVWQMHFGRGLVETAEDFGAQASIPTHPELLDWLAVQFVESGWDIKKLHKLVVMSAAYRQDSNATREMLERDPANVLLARGVRMRMSAEMVRDQALAAAGLLVPKVGGPSVMPYQPSGVWNPLNAAAAVYPDATQVPADEHHRRSLYTFVKRNAPHPGMQIFDFPGRDESKARRRVSNSPLQALELLNDPQFVEAYRQLATHAYATSSDADERIATIFQIARRESPKAEQMQILREFYAKQLDRFGADAKAASELVSIGITPVEGNVDAVQLAALTNVTALIMNTPDAYTIR